MVNSENENKPQRKLFYGLFVFPLIIAVGMAVLLCTIVLLTREKETPESLISDIKTGSPSKRWQKAYELSNDVNKSGEPMRPGSTLREALGILKNPVGYDPKTRAFMALVVARSNDPVTRSELRNILKNETNPSVQINLIWALGIMNAKEAGPQVSAFLQNEDPSLRKISAYTVGALGEKSAIPQLEKLLNDETRDVRWNAALSLTRLGTDSSYSVIMKMLDRQYLASSEGLSEEKIEHVMINAVKGLARLKKPEGMVLLAKISNEEKNLKVRQAAIEAMKGENQESTAQAA